MSEAAVEIVRYDPVHRPRHYDLGNGLEAIDLIEDLFGLEGHLPQAMIYLLRAGRKGPALEDYSKALWYVRRCLAKEDLWHAPIARFPGIAIEHSLRVEPTDTARFARAAITRAAISIRGDVWRQHLQIAERALLELVRDAA